MKYFLGFLIFLGVTALAYEHYVLGVSIILGVALIEWVVAFLAEKVMEVYALMPKVSLDISETLALVWASWFFRNGVNLSSLSLFYTALLVNSQHFDVKVNVGLIDAFEHNHPSLRLKNSHNVLPLGKAVYYYIRLKTPFPTILLHHISRAIIITKKLGATQQQAEMGIIPSFLKMILRWMASVRG